MGLFSSKGKRAKEAERRKEAQAWFDRKAAEIRPILVEKFKAYQTRNLKGVSPQEFRKALESRVGVVDAGSEGYGADVDRQRDLSVKFHWGHNHDFGDFRMEGRMDDRHINLMANFISLFPVTLDDFQGKDVFDIGCWTGGTTLLLAALAKSVYAIEEVQKYADTAGYLARCFGLKDRVTVARRSIYECNADDLRGRFDIVYFPSVIYHLTDPVLALRVLYNALKPGGFILLESGGLNHSDALCRFEGSFVSATGSKDRLNRGGWNWFVPSPLATERMMREAGFEQIESVWHETVNRVYAYGKKVSQVGICRAGLSVPNIP